MKHHRLILALALGGALLTGCNKDDEAVLPNNPTTPQEKPGGEVPEGYFVATFNAAPETRAAIAGPSSRVRNLRYMVFDLAKTGFPLIKERVVFDAAAGTDLSWPYTTFTDTLPKGGSYQAIFIANALNDNVITNYKGTGQGAATALVNLPNYVMDDNSELYKDVVSFIESTAEMNILLERIITKTSLHRNFIDPNDALTSLKNSILKQLADGNIIEEQLDAIGFRSLIYDALDLGTFGNLTYSIAGGLDNLVDAVYGALLEPLVSVLDTMLLDYLINMLEDTLTANTDQTTLVGWLGGEILNPWANAAMGVATIDGFPKSVLLTSGVVQEIYPDGSKFAFPITSPSLLDPGIKVLEIKGFNGNHTVQHIDALRQGIVGGFVVDGLLDDNFLIPALLMDVDEPVSWTSQTNFQYGSDFSFIDLNLNSYDPTVNTAPEPLDIDVALGDILPVEEILNNALSLLPVIGPVVGDVVALVLDPLLELRIELSINVPLLGIDDLSLDADWEPVAQGSTAPTVE